MVGLYVYLFFFNDTATTEIYTLSLHDALPISCRSRSDSRSRSPTGSWTPSIPSAPVWSSRRSTSACPSAARSEEHTSELQSRQYLVCRLLLEKKKNSQTLACTKHITL